VLGTVRRTAGRAPPRRRCREGSGERPRLEAPRSGASPLAAKGAELRKQLNPAQAQRMQEVTTGVIERPDLAARVVQAWLKG
jgi:hypothetical protein